MSFAFLLASQDPVLHSFVTACHFAEAEEKQRENTAVDLAPQRACEKNAKHTHPVLEQDKEIILEILKNNRRAYEALSSPNGDTSQFPLTSIIYKSLT